MAEILLVDDEPAVRWVVADCLSRLGHRTREAGDGLQALGMLRETPPDLLLCDVVMPRMDGFGLLREVLAPGRPWIPFVFLTSQEDGEAMRLAQDWGACGYVRKPCVEADLRSAIEAALACEPRTITEPLPLPAEVIEEIPEASAPVPEEPPAPPPALRGPTGASRLVAAPPLAPGEERGTPSRGGIVGALRGVFGRGR